LADEAAVAPDTQPATAGYDSAKKDQHEVGELPPQGHVPAQMHAWAIRRARH